MACTLLVKKHKAKQNIEVTEFCYHHVTGCSSFMRLQEKTNNLSLLLTRQSLLSHK